MLSYCLKCKRYTESKNPKVVKTKNERIMVLSNCAICESIKLRFIKEQESKGLLNMISKIPLVGPSLI